MPESTEFVMAPPHPQGLLFVLSGPSGVGKDAVIVRLKADQVPLHYVVTTTTRPRRDYEEDGREYCFVSRDRFTDMVVHGRLLEWAKVYGNLYGVPREDVRVALNEGRDVLAKPDVQGAATIRSIVPEAVSIFLAPPSFDALKARLLRRRSETPETLACRLEVAAQEMQRASEFDYLVVNEDEHIELAVERIKAIIVAEHCRLSPRFVTL